MGVIDQQTYDLAIKSKFMTLEIAIEHVLALARKGIDNEFDRVAYDTIEDFVVNQMNEIF